MRFLKRLLAGFLLLCSSLLVFVLCGEIFSRAFGADVALIKPLLKDMTVHPLNHRTSDNDELMYELVPGSRVSYDWPQKFTVEVNSLGFRDRERSVNKPEGTLRIICLGASTVYGPTMNGDETYPYYLEKLLNEKLKKPVEVWNLGLCGSVMRQHVERARIAVEKFNPDALIFYQSNTGARSLLAGRPYGQFFRKSPALFSENLRYIPFRDKEWGVAVFNRSYFWRTIVIAANYIITAPHNNPDHYDETPNARAFTEFAKSFGDKIPIFIIFCPETPQRTDYVESLNVIRIDLYSPENLPDGYKLEYLTAHPPAYVYKWFADIIGRELISSGALDKKGLR